MPSAKRIAIIGAGIAGLSAARALEDSCDVVLFDKSRGVGGRMSTRYTDTYEFDHGAQYFTAQDAAFLAAVEDGIKAGVIKPWDARALYLKDGKMEPDTGRQRYVGTPRMNSWPKYLAKDLTIHLGERISRISREGQVWTLNFESSRASETFDGVICTLPPAQAEQVLPKDFAHYTDVKKAKLDACFAVMIGLDRDLNLGWDTLRVNAPPVAWMAVNSAKPGRKHAPSTLVIHADAVWSETHQDAERDWVQAQLIDQAEVITKFNLAEAPHIATHRWLYASPSERLEASQNNVYYDATLNLAACGDWCAGGRVQGAWLSGRAAALEILKKLA
ncbi:NAD(P)/FAD-dependent oxidoreductase [Litorimonas sp. RW-G-Af-16]|uniref:NAD(P)/FAD-dependent oxidoreductase n=1 Tax=Litorimonas sp. RW-G-Af-16 TaxID=3241168 RepID=UPI00390C9096